MLLKGPPGFGKTIAACSLALDGPVYLAYFDKNQPVELLNFYKKHRPEVLNNIDYDIYSSQNAHEYLNKLITFAERGTSYTAIITDSATNLTSAAVNWSLGFRDRKDGAKKDPKNKDAMQMIPDFDEYKVETGLVTQALDILTSLPCHNIWTAHPLPTLKMEGSGKSITVSKVSSIVSYGSKVGAMIPGRFNEIYHFAKKVDWSGEGKNRFIVCTDMIGDDYAKTSFNLPREIDITDQLFWEVMKPLYNAAVEEVMLGEVKGKDSIGEAKTVSAKMPWQ